MPFAPELIDEVRKRADLVALARATTALRQQGSRLLGRCPFHKERSPSFSVDADKGVFYCFGCQVGGDAIAFVMRMQGYSFTEAVRHLADALGLQIAGDSPHEREALRHKERLRRTLAQLQPLYRKALSSPAGHTARRYLQSRRVRPDIARMYGVGFGGERAQLTEWLSQADIRADDLAAAGVAGTSGGTLFAGRLTFPILDVAGHICGFGGRQLQTDAPGAKYLNSRDSDVFAKQRELFGLGQAAPAIRQQGMALVCEGYFDVLALAQAGVEGAVAALGTALTATHAEMLARLTAHVVLVFDGDAAGMRAARKAALPLKAHGMRVDVARLPSGEDPSSMLAKRGEQALQAAIDARAPAIDVFIAQAFSPDLSSIEGKVAAADAVAPLILALSSTLERELYVARVAERVGVPADSLLRDWQQKARRAPAAGAGRAKSADAGPGGAAASAPARAPSVRRAAPAPAEPPARGQHADAPSALPPAPADHDGPWTAKDARRLAEQELDMLRELLLFAEARTRVEPLAEYFVTPQFRNFLETLTAPIAGEDDAACEKVFDRVLTQCVTHAPWQLKLRAVQLISSQTLDEGQVRANRTVDDILRRLKRRQVDWTLKRVLRELGEAEARGEATDALLRRKQILTARKRALSDPKRQAP